MPTQVLVGPSAGSRLPAFLPAFLRSFPGPGSSNLSRRVGASSLGLKHQEMVDSTGIYLTGWGPSSLANLVYDSNN